MPSPLVTSGDYLAQLGLAKNHMAGWQLHGRGAVPERWLTCSWSWPAAGSLRSSCSQGAMLQTNRSWLHHSGLSDQQDRATPTTGDWLRWPGALHDWQNPTRAGGVVRAPRWLWRSWSPQAVSSAQNQHRTRFRGLQSQRAVEAGAPAGSLSRS